MTGGVVDEERDEVVVEVPYGFLSGPWVPPAPEPIPEQVAAAAALPGNSKELEPARLCGHEVLIAINRGGDFCSGQCEKVWAEMTVRQQRRHRRLRADRDLWVDAAAEWEKRLSALRGRRD